VLYNIKNNQQLDSLYTLSELFPFFFLFSCAVAAVVAACSENLTFQVRLAVKDNNFERLMGFCGMWDVNVHIYNHFV
jgi:hypothetical protein